MSTPFRNTLAMTCPVCHVALQPTVRESIEIDFCPQCRGVWLDRGELDKIIEREAGFGDPDARRPRPEGVAAPVGDPYYRRRDDDDDNDDRHGYGGRPRKRKGLLGELFDFD